MKIKSIEISNVKGIANKTFNLDLMPNKPNILVAPNGFGKSSFGIAFDSLKSNRLELDDKNYYEGKTDNRPELTVIVEENACQQTFTANDTINNISENFDVFVINSQLEAKATLLSFKGKSIAKPTMEISTTILIASIPAKITFDYSLSNIKRVFGGNGKILPDINNVFHNGYLLSQIEETIELKKFNQIKISKSIELIKEEINERKGTTEQVLKWIMDEKLDSLRAIDELNKLACLIKSCDFPSIKDEYHSFLAALQIIIVFQLIGSDFRKACKYQYYLDLKKGYIDTIKSFNSTRLEIKPKEDKKKGLIVEWPKAHEISNGQRDILSFITLMLKARRSFTKKNCILIIDEVFDYLDDANLISFQYFVTNFIQYMKKEGRLFFPLLMTHLDPMYFNHFCFNKHKIKVHYLKEVTATASLNLLKLIRLREDSSIKINVDQYYFHYHPSKINITTEFAALGLNPAWNESDKFYAFINNEINKYLNDENDYDPLAICFGVRVHIEYLLFEQITDSIKQEQFINEQHGTKNKLEYCEQIAINVPETFYFLGIIYNDELHWHNRFDISVPIAIKLENFTIKKLIRDVFEKSFMSIT